jgi:uncharacterized protein (TIGR02217 family)
MSFFNATTSGAVFPLECQRLTAGPGWNTRIVRTRSGAEQRNAEWSDALRTFDAATGVRTLSDLRTLEQHFNAMRGQLHGFPLLDRTKYSVTAEGFGTGDGSTTAFQLTINDGNAANAYNREIYKPKQTISISKNAVLQTVTTHYTVDYATGIVTFTSAPAAANALTWTGEFYVPCRYAIDRIPYELFVWKDGGQQLASGPVIPITEIRDIA